MILSISYSLEKIVIVEIDKLGQGGNGGEDSSALLMKMLNSTIGALTRH